MKNERAFFQAVLTVAALCLLSLLQARAALAVEPAGAWVASKHLNVRQPQPATLPGVADDLHHGVYQTIPYFGFTRDPGGNFVLLCERADPLRLVAEGEHTFAIQDAGAKLVFDAVGRSFTPTSAVPACGLEATRYVQAARARSCADTDDPSCLPVGDQDWNSAFGNRADCADLANDGWNVLTMDLPPHIENSGATSAVFGFPDGGTKEWRPSPSNRAIPWGQVWTRKDLTETSARHAMVTSEAELRANLTSGQSFGVHDAGFSFSQNSTFHSMTEKLYSRELSYMTSDIVATTYALVQDKRNAKLSVGFTRALDLLRDGITDAEWADFLEEFGTHYSYALSCGGRGQQRIEIRGDKAAALLDQGVDFESGLEAGVKGSIEGVEFDVGGSLGAQKAQSDLQRILDASEREEKTSQCFGSVNCLGDSASDAANEDIPVWLDLRPLWELLGPPFFTDFETAVTLRNAVRKRIDGTLAGAKQRTDPAVRFVRWTFDKLGLFVDDQEFHGAGDPDAEQKMFGALLKISVACPAGGGSCTGSVLDQGVLLSQLPGMAEVWGSFAGSLESVDVTMSSAVAPEQQFVFGARLPVSVTIPVKDLEAGGRHDFLIKAQEVLIGRAAPEQIGLAFHLEVVDPQAVLSTQ